MFRRRKPPADPTLLVLIDLIQDYEVLAPVLLGLRDAGHAPRIAVSRWLQRRAPRIAVGLRAANLAFEWTHRPALLAGAGPDLAGVKTLLTASESSAGPHRWCRAFTVRAKAAGVTTATLQHGLDNLEALRPGDGQLDIVSDVMFVWPNEAHWPDDLPLAVRERLIATGRPRTPAVAKPPRFDVGVFENLHARHYDDADRDKVLAAALDLCRRRPELRILLRAHPAGGWLDTVASAFRGLPNVTLTLSAEARRDSRAAADVVAEAARVVTTPSTIALDAIQAGRPVALALAGGPAYLPLQQLGRLSDWLAFASDAPVPTPENAAFLAIHDLPGDAVARIVAHLATPRGISMPNAPIGARTASGSCNGPW